MKARVDRVICYAGEEYRLEAGQRAPAMPDALREILIKSGYLEVLEAPVQKPAPRKPKEG